MCRAREYHDTEFDYRNCFSNISMLSGLKSITIPNSVTDIGDNAFYEVSVEHLYIKKNSDVANATETLVADMMDSSIGQLSVTGETEELSLTSIAVVEGSALQNYEVGESINVDGLMLELSYSTGEAGFEPQTEIVAYVDGNMAFAPALEQLTSLAAGEQEIEITYLDGLESLEDVKTEAGKGLIISVSRKEQTAPVGLSDGVGKISGTDENMEYADSAEASDWITCSVDSTPVSGGTWYVRYKENDTYMASEAIEIAVTAEPEQEPEPETGDSNAAVLWLAIATLGTVGVVVARRKRIQISR